MGKDKDKKHQAAPLKGTATKIFYIKAFSDACAKFKSGWG